MKLGFSLLDSHSVSVSAPDSGHAAFPHGRLELLTKCGHQVG